MIYGMDKYRRKEILKGEVLIVLDNSISNTETI